MNHSLQLGVGGSQNVLALRRPQLSSSDDQSLWLEIWVMTSMSEHPTVSDPSHQKPGQHPSWTFNTLHSGL